MSDSLSPLSTYRQGHFFSPAKINLFFRVLSKRSDGYHNIASLYQTINFGDDLFVNKTAGQDLFTTSDRTLPLGKGNLVVRAIQLFRESYPLPSVHIHLKKRIPKEAGLGGGSSNAATTLWALNQISGSLAGLDDLIRMGSEIGSDVPFFFPGERHIVQVEERR